MRTIKFGDEGFEVIRLQEILELPQTGLFSADVHDSVVEFQKLHGLTADGIVGPITWDALLVGYDADTNNVKEFQEYMLSPGKQIKNAKGELVWLPNYWTGPFKKQWLFIHHTAGWDNPYQTIDIWDKDSKTVATEFVVGGKSITGKDKNHDGLVLKCMPDGAWAAHLTVGNTQVHRESIGIELCNMGGLTKGGYFKIAEGKQSWVDGQTNTFYTAYGNPVAESEVYDLGWKYRYHQYFHKYSTAQVQACYDIIKHAQHKYGLDVKGGLQKLIAEKGVQKAFEFMPEYVSKVPGIYVHGNIFDGKNDIFPQQDMIDMIMSL